MAELKVVKTYLKVWGHGRSWVVHRVDATGNIVWASHWMNTKEMADAHMSSL